MKDKKVKVNEYIPNNAVALFINIDGKKYSKGFKLLDYSIDNIKECFRMLSWFGVEIIKEYKK